MKILFGSGTIALNNNSFNDYYNSYIKSIIQEAPKKENYYKVTTYKNISIFYNDDGTEPHLTLRFSRNKEVIENFSLILCLKKIIDYMYDPKYGNIINWTNKYINGWWGFTFNCYYSHIKFCAELSQKNPKQFYIKTYLGKNQKARQSDTLRSLPF